MANHEQRRFTVFAAFLCCAEWYFTRFQYLLERQIVRKDEKREIMGANYLKIRYTGLAGCIGRINARTLKISITKKG